MSHVATVVVLAQDEERVEQSLVRVWRALEREDTPPQQIAQAAAGGNKAMQAAVFIGAHNYLGCEDFVEAFGRELAGWNHPHAWPEETQLLIKDEHDASFGVFEFSLATRRMQQVVVARRA